VTSHPAVKAATSHRTSDSVVLRSFSWLIQGLGAEAAGTRRNEMLSMSYKQRAHALYNWRNVQSTVARRLVSRWRTRASKGLDPSKVGSKAPGRKCTRVERPRIDTNSHESSPRHTYRVICWRAKLSASVRSQSHTSTGKAVRFGGWKFGSHAHISLLCRSRSQEKPGAIKSVGQFFIIPDQYFSQSLLARVVLNWSMASALRSSHQAPAILSRF